MPSVVEILKKNNNKENIGKTGKELGEMVSQKLNQKNMQGRMFNGFPTLFSHEQLQPLISEYYNILRNASFDEDYNIDVETKTAIDRWINNLSGLVCYHLLDAQGFLKAELINFLKLDKADRETLENNKTAILCSGFFNALDYSIKHATELHTQKNHDPSEAHRAIMSYFNKNFNSEHYYLARHMQIYNDEHNSIRQTIFDFIPKLDKANENLANRIKKDTQKNTGLLTKKSAVEKATRLISDFKEGLLSPIELKQDMEKILNNLVATERVVSFGIFKHYPDKSHNSTQTLISQLVNVSQKLVNFYQMDFPSEQANKSSIRLDNKLSPE